MLRSVLFGAALVAMLAATSGCSICQAPDDCAYSAYGGVYPRADMYHGRVGSAFDPAGGQLASWESAEAIEEIDPGTVDEPSADDPLLEPPTDEPDEMPDGAGELETAY